MFTKVDEIWYTPFVGKDDIPEMVVRVCKELQVISRYYASDMTDFELLENGIDPDMVNEFCMFDESEWPELEKYYQDENGMYNMDNAGMVGTKQYRAQLIAQRIDPETNESIYAEEQHEPTYEEWKASLHPGWVEFPHGLIGSGQRPDYVERLIREREEFEEYAMAEEERMYR